MSFVRMLSPRTGSRSRSRHANPNGVPGPSSSSSSFLSGTQITSLPRSDSPQRVSSSSKTRQSKSQREQSGSTQSALDPKLRLNLPSFAAVYLPYHPPPLPGQDPPESDKELKGELEITIPPLPSESEEDTRGRSITRKGISNFRRDVKRIVKVKTIRLVLRSYFRIHGIVAGKKGKRKLERVIFERKVENVGGDEGISLEEGTQRFEFTMIIPASLAPHNWVGGEGITASITHQLHAELEGLPEEIPSSHGSGSTTPQIPVPTSFFGKGKSKALSPFATSGRRTPKTPTYPSNPIQLNSTSTGASRSPSPRGSFDYGQPDSRSIEAALLAATRQMSVSNSESNPTELEPPRAPSYDESQAQARRGSTTPTGRSEDSGIKEEVEWLRGTHSTKRLVEVIYNPHPTGAVSQLDERISSSAPGLGEYHLRMAAEEWHVAGWPLFRFSLPDPAPTVTVFAFKYSMSQTVKVTPPPPSTNISGTGTSTPPIDNDFPPDPITFTTTFPFVERGEKPPRRFEHPGPEWAALWRGKQAGGRDDKAYTIEAKGQLPKDDVMRPSTLPGLVTPIEITHALTTEMFFSIWGETATGEKMTMPGPGGLRVMRVTRPVVVPSCGLIPQELNLPNYEDTDELGPSGPCALCKKYPYEKICTACPSTIIPHLRHDLDPSIIGGDRTGKCPLCAGKSFMPEGKGNWDSCACGLAKGHTEERMRAFVREMEAEMFGGIGNGEDGEEGDGVGANGSSRRKEGEERSRGRSSVRE